MWAEVEQIWIEYRDQDSHDLLDPFFDLPSPDALRELDRREARARSSGVWSYKGAIRMAALYYAWSHAQADWPQE